MLHSATDTDHMWGLPALAPEFCITHCTAKDKTVVLTMRAPLAKRLVMR